jgi:adenylyl cyclase-associated protein
LKSQAQNLFAEIQQKTANLSLTHVEKNAHKKNPPANQPEVIPKKPVAAATKATTAEVKKDPKKEFKMNTWYVENYGKEIVKFEGEEVESNYGFALIKCTDTTLVISGKCKSVMLENCSNIKIIIDSVLAMVEIINSKKITTTIKESCPQFNIERSNGVHLYLFEPAKNCKINSTCSMTMVVHYPKKDATEDDDWLDIAIPETLLTQIKNDRLTSEPLEGME